MSILNTILLFTHNNRFLGIHLSNYNEPLFRKLVCLDAKVFLSVRGTHKIKVLEFMLSLKVSFLFYRSIRHSYTNSRNLIYQVVFLNDLKNSNLYF